MSRRNTKNDTEKRRREEQRIKRKVDRRRRTTSKNENNATATSANNETTNNEAIPKEIEQEATPEEIDHEQLHNEDAMLKEAVLEHAAYLGIDPIAEPELLHLAEESMLAQPPDGWRSLSDESGNPFYYNEQTKETQWEHPEDEHYRQMVRDLKQAKLAHAQAISQSQSSSNPSTNSTAITTTTTTATTKVLTTNGATATATSTNQDSEQKEETWDDWDEEDGETEENENTIPNDGASNIVSVNADGSDTQNNHEIMEDWDSEEEDSDSGAPPRIPSRGKNRKVTAVNQNENDDDPPPAPSARPATLSGLKGKRKSVLSTLIDQNKSNKSNNTSQNHSNTIKNASPTRGKSSTNNNGDLAKALFHAEAEAKELRAELARVHANAAVQKAEGIRETQQQDARIRILQNEITSERAISLRDSSRAHELDRKIKDLTDERDTFKDLYENASKEKQRSPPASPNSKILEDIEKMAATAQIQALEAKVSGLEDEKEELEARVDRAMKMAREAQAAERDMEESLEELKSETAQQKPPSPIKMDMNVLKQQQSDAVDRAKKSTRERMKLEHDRTISKLKVEHQTLITTLKNQLQNTTENMNKEKINLQNKMDSQNNLLQEALSNEIAKRELYEKREIAQADAMLAQERTTESRIAAARTDSDRRLRQVEQCLSLAEERAERAEAEAHNVLVESQLASTLGVKVYELQREKDIHLVNIQASRDAIDQMRIQMAEASKSHEHLMKQIDQGKMERENLMARNNSLTNELRMGSSGSSGNAHGGAVNTLQNALVASEQRNVELTRRAAETEAKSQSVQKVLQRLVL